MHICKNCRQEINFTVFIDWRGWLHLNGERYCYTESPVAEPAED